MKRLASLYPLLYLLTALCSAANTSMAQQTVKGQILDAYTHQSLPFATIKLGDTREGLVSDLNGRFSITVNGNVSYLEVSYMGYDAQKITLPAKQETLIISLKPQEKTLNEVVVTPQYDKIRRIMNAAIAHKNENNPDKYDWYRCHVYYKMIADLVPTDSILSKDTSKDAEMFRAFLQSQHLLMSETYSIRTWQRPQHLQEEVLATRLSGLKKSMFTSLVTNVLPFHSYDDYIKLNGKDYHNPVSKGYGLHYDFGLQDELIQGKDTIWILSYKPKKDPSGLRGTVYINSDGYAIGQLIANAKDNDLKRRLRIEQQYSKVEGHWFPIQLNYIMDAETKMDSSMHEIHMVGNSQIDSISFNKDDHFHFDRTHTVKLRPRADELSDTAWQRIRPVALDKKEERTYVFDDSIVDAVHGERYLNLLRKLPEGKVPLGPVDIDLKRILAINPYESVRLGLGLQTNEKVIKWLSVGGWGGYGFKDVHWKYGVFAEAYADPYKEFTFKVAYDDDLHDPGRIQINRELDKNFLNIFLLRRVDEVKSYSASIRKRAGYWNLELSAKQENIVPQYNYYYQYEGAGYNEYKAKEASFGFRYAYAERTAPIFNYYRSLGSKYPIWYGKITTGTLDVGSAELPYTQALSAVAYHKHINRIGYEHFLLEGGKSWSNDPLPLSKNFAGNGFNYNETGSLYAFGGLMTITPYQYYSDQFVSFIWRHDFDWKLYTLSFKGTKYSSAPSISLGYNMLYGNMDHPEVQQGAVFSIPSQPYHETGLLLRGLLRSRNSSYYSCMIAGYYYHWTEGAFDAKNNGRFVLGVDYEF